MSPARKQSRMVISLLTVKNRNPLQVTGARKKAKPALHSCRRASVDVPSSGVARFGDESRPSDGGLGQVRDLQGQDAQGRGLRDAQGRAREVRVHQNRVLPAC